MIFSFLCYVSVIANLIYAVPLLEERAEKRSCNTMKYDDLESLSGTCESFASCKKYISLPEQTSSNAKCNSRTETCCVRRECDLNDSRAWVNAVQTYCTVRNNMGNSLSDQERSGVIGVHQGSCPGPHIPHGQDTSDHALVCLPTVGPVGVENSGNVEASGDIETPSDIEVADVSGAEDAYPDEETQNFDENTIDS